MWPVSTQCEAMRDAFTLQFPKTDRCSLILVACFLENCPVLLLEQPLHWALQMIADCMIDFVWFEKTGYCL